MLSLESAYPPRALATSLALPCRAQHCADIASTEDLQQVIRRAHNESMQLQLLGGGTNAVSYTHLTLPTIYSV